MSSYSFCFITLPVIFSIHYAFAVNGRNRSFLNNVPRINFQDEEFPSGSDQESRDSAATSRPILKTTKKPRKVLNSTDLPPSSAREQAKLDYELLQDRLSKFPHSKLQIPKPNNRTDSKNNETIVKHVEPSEAVSEDRLAEAKSELNEYESRLKLLKPESDSSAENKGHKTSAVNSTLVTLLEDLLNKANPVNPKRSHTGKQITVIPLPGNNKPSWFITPPPLPEEALEVLNNGQVADSNLNPDEVEKPLTIDFVPAGKQLPLFAPPAQVSDSDITKMAYHQAGDSRFNWLISYQNHDKVSRKSSPSFDSELQ